LSSQLTSKDASERIHPGCKVFQPDLCPISLWRCERLLNVSPEAVLRDMPWVQKCGFSSEIQTS
jgi:hypothetical protein